MKTCSPQDARFALVTVCAITKKLTITRYFRTEAGARMARMHANKRSMLSASPLIIYNIESARSAIAEDFKY